MGFEYHQFLNIALLPLAHDIFPLVRLYNKPTWMLNNYLDRSYMPKRGYISNFPIN